MRTDGKGSYIMTHPNEDVLKHGYDAIARGDVEALTSTWQDDIVIHIPGNHQLSGEYRGKDEALGFFGRQMELADNARIEVEDISASDRHGFVLVTGHMERGGETVRERGIHVHRMENNKIAESWSLPFNQAVVDEFWS